MILERLVMENFRQFRGRQEMVFSDLRERNVTIVHAENGFGKTTLLKALLWCLYGRDGLLGIDGEPDDFEKPDRIIHEGLAHGGGDPSRVLAKVELTFKHDGDRYILIRQLSLAQQNLKAAQTILSLEVMRNGETFALERPHQRIQSIVPEGIRRLLFFNGERINYLAMEKNSAEVTEAIHQMLGLRLLQTTIKDLRHQNVLGRLRGELKEATSDEKRDLLDGLAAKEQRLDDLRDHLDQGKRNLSALDEEVRLVDAKLAANREAHELQAKRIRLQSERRELADRRAEIETRLAKLLAEDGYTLLTGDLVRLGREVVARLRGEGKIPARVLNSFLHELLERKACICTRRLDHGTPERAAVEQLLTIAGDQDFNNAVGALDHAMGLLEGVASQTEVQLKDLNRERLELARDIRERDEEIDEIHQALGGKKDEEVQELEEKRKQLLLDRDSEHAELGRIEGRIEDLQAEIADLECQIRGIEDMEENAARAQRRVDAVEDSAALLEQILQAETEDLRPLLNAEIDRHFRMIIDRDYWAELTNDFVLRIRKRVAGSGGEAGPATEIDAALSTGQRTVTSLVFIASLVALAKRRSEIPTILKGLSGSAYPVAIDSPFGSLSIFREGVAHYIPELAPQVVLFVSPKQYEGEVEEALNRAGRVGKRYYLVYHGPAIPERANPELVVNEQRIPQYVPADNEEYTEIVEL